MHPKMNDNANFCKWTVAKKILWATPTSTRTLHDNLAEYFNGLPMGRIYSRILVKSFDVVIFGFIS